MAEPQIYKPAPGARISTADIQVVGQTLAAMADRNGALHPHGVLDEARDTASPLHRFFTWDDGKAAEAYRLDEARRLIRSVRVVINRSSEQVPLEVRAFVRVTSEKQSNYIPVASVMSDEDMRRQLLAKALLELQNFRRKYATLSELAVFFDAMQSLPMAQTA